MTRALVVYESLWGNTEKIARAIAGRLLNGAGVDVFDSDDAPTSVEGYHLLVVGGPTHAFSMSRPATREEAVKGHSAPHRPDRGIREWLDQLARPAAKIPAATFDTATKPQTFRVHGYEGPLLDGELERAGAWADNVLTPIGVSASAHPARP